MREGPLLGLLVLGLAASCEFCPSCLVGQFGACELDPEFRMLLVIVIWCGGFGILDVPFLFAKKCESGLE